MVTRIQPKNPGYYQTNGTGRDTYINYNNGGYSKKNITFNAIEVGSFKNKTL